MVRFKNRYLLVDLHELPGEYCNSEKALVRFVKSQAEEMMGELFIAKISYSLQVKYLAL